MSRLPICPGLLLILTGKTLAGLESLSMPSTAINPELEWKQIKELIARYGLEEDLENIIIPFSDKSGRVKRCHILKRPFIRIVYPDRHYVDYPLEDVIEATVRFPEILLSEALASDI